MSDAGKEVELLLLGAAVKHYGSRVVPAMPSEELKVAAESLETFATELEAASTIETGAAAEGANIAIQLAKWCEGSRFEVLSDMPDAVRSAIPPTNRHEHQPHAVIRVDTKGSKGESEFDEAAASHPITTAFHGSAAHNWFSIAHNGLRNFSGIDGFKGGTLFGEGIYLSTSLHVAHDFAGAGPSILPQCGLVKPSKFCIVGMFDVAVDPTWVKSGELDSSVPREYIVVQQASLVRLRYLLVYGEPGNLTRRPTEARAGSAPTQNNDGRILGFSGESVRRIVGYVAAAVLVAWLAFYYQAQALESKKARLRRWM